MAEMAKLTETVEFWVLTLCAYYKHCISPCQAYYSIYTTVLNTLELTAIKARTHSNFRVLDLF